MVVETGRRSAHPVMHLPVAGNGTRIVGSRVIFAKPRSSPFASRSAVITTSAQKRRPVKPEAKPQEPQKPERKPQQQPEPVPA